MDFGGLIRILFGWILASPQIDKFFLICSFFSDALAFLEGVRFGCAFGLAMATFILFLLLGGLRLAYLAMHCYRKKKDGPSSHTR